MVQEHLQLKRTNNDALNITNDIAYNWTTTDDNYTTDNTNNNIGGVADTYYIDTNKDSITDISLTIAAV